MRRSFATVAAALAALVLAACGQGDGAGSSQAQARPDRTCDQIDLSRPPAEPVRIRIGHGAAAEEPFWLMKLREQVTEHQGSWYTTEYVPFRGTEERLQAYQAGALDAAMISPQAFITGVSRGLELGAVVTLIREGEPGAFSGTYLAAEGSGITSPAQLKGKTIAILDFGSQWDLLAKAGVAKGGGDFDSDAEYVVLPFPAQGEALKGGRVQVIGLPEPFYTLAKAQGGVTDVFTARDVIPFPHDLLMLAFDRGFVQENTGAVCAFRADYQRALEFYEENKQQARRVLADSEFVPLPYPVYQRVKDYGRPAEGRFDAQSLARLQDLMLELGVIREDDKVDVQSLVIPGITAGT